MQRHRISVWLLCVQLKTERILTSLPRLYELYMILSDFVLQHISITYRIESTLGWQNLISLLTCVSFNCEAQYQGESEEFKEHAFLLVVESQA